MKLITVLTILAVIASAATVLFVLHAETDSSSAEVNESGWCGPDAYYYIYSDGTLEISGSGSVYDYNDFTHPPWYDHREDIRKIVIGNDITQLGASAFIGLKYVTELTIPITINSVVSDVSPAFAGCYRIEKINFTVGKDGYGFDYAAYPDSNSWYQNTPWYESRDNLKTVTFADGTIHIGNDAFRELNITAVNLPDSVTSLGNHCFFNCAGITDITIPVSLNSYGNEKYPAFQGCVAVNSVTITRGNGVPFDYSHWWGSSDNANLAPWNMNHSITKKVVISDDVTSLGKYMSFGCNIGELTIPVNVKCGDSKAFYVDGEGFTNLTKLTITKGNGSGPDYDDSSCKYNPWNTATKIDLLTVEEGVTRLGAYTFYGCTAPKVVLPNSLGALGAYTFGRCNIQDLTIPISLNAVWLDKYPAFGYPQRGMTTITFTPGTGYGFDYAKNEGSNCWCENTPWYISLRCVSTIVFEEGIKHIGTNAFHDLMIGCIRLPSTVESLGEYAFYQCWHVSGLVIPISLDAVGSAEHPAFYLSDFVYIVFTPGKNGIGFDYREDYLPPWIAGHGGPVRNLDFEKGINYIGQYAFYGYNFHKTNGDVVEPTAENLSGNNYLAKTSGEMWINPYSDAQDTPAAEPQSGTEYEGTDCDVPDTKIKVVIDRDVPPDFHIPRTGDILNNRDTKYL